MSETKNCRYCGVPMTIGVNCTEKQFANQRRKCSPCHRAYINAWQEAVKTGTHVPAQYKQRVVRTCLACEAVLIPGVNAKAKNPRCNPCHDIFRKEDYARRVSTPEKRAIHNARSIKANRKWRKENPDKLAAAVRSWNERNPDKVREYRKKFYEKRRNK
jgi:hypothetical protein